MLNTFYRWFDEFMNNRNSLNQFKVLQTKQKHKSSDRLAVSWYEKRKYRVNCAAILTGKLIHSAKRNLITKLIISIDIELLFKFHCYLTRALLTSQLKIDQRKKKHNIICT